MALELADLAVVGAGPAGLAAAAEVSRRGGKVIVLDEAPIPGGRLASQVHWESAPSHGGSGFWSNGREKAKRLVEEAQAAGVRILTGLSVWGVFPGWYVCVVPSDFRQKQVDSVGDLQVKALLLATGAAQKPIVFPGWTLPGVLMIGAAQTLLNLYHTLPGTQAVFLGSNPLALATAHLMSAVGVEIRGIVLPPPDGAPWDSLSPENAIRELARFSKYAPGALLGLAAQVAGHLSTLAAKFFPQAGINVWGMPLKLRHAGVAVRGEGRVQKVLVANLSEDGSVEPGKEEEWPVDVVITSGGLYPLGELPQLAGCPMVYSADLGGYVPIHNDCFETLVPGVFIAGSVTGVESARVAQAQGRVAGLAAAAHLGLVSSLAFDREMPIFQRAVEDARAEGIPLLPNVKAARKGLAEHWKRQSAAASIR